MFTAEYAGLLALNDCGAIKVPKPVCFGQTAAHSYLVTEYLPLTGIIDQRRLGHELARLHRCFGEQYGWKRDNTIGTTLQLNAQTGDWHMFWRDRRLLPQLKLAAVNGYDGRLQKNGEQLLSKLDKLLTGHQPQPSLLHGDLWSGNVAALADGRPVIFDPAVYYGDRETDLAMTELFGGFGRDFYAAYHEQWPLDNGYPLRRELYKLYHVLNHLNLFGSAYLQQAERIIQELLAEL